MGVLAAVLIGALAYVGAGHLLGLIRVRDWPGRWRRRSAASRASGGPHSRLLHRLAASLLWAGVGLIAAWVATGSLWIAGAPALFLSTRPRRMRERRRLSELQELQEAWPDGIRHMGASLRSGRTVQASVVDLATTGPEPLRRAFRGFEPLASALSPAAALGVVREQLADPTTDRVVEVLLVAQEVGGRAVPAVLDDMAVAVSDDLKTVEEIHSASLEQRLNARIVFILPWLVLALLTSRAGVYRSFYQSRPGITIIVVAAVLSSAGMALASRLGREPLEHRVLGAANHG